MTRVLDPYFLQNEGKMKLVRNIKSAGPIVICNRTYACLQLIAKCIIAKILCRCKCFLIECGNFLFRGIALDYFLNVEYRAYGFVHVIIFAYDLSCHDDPSAVLKFT